MAKKNLIPIAAVAGGVALALGGKKKSPKKKSSTSNKPTAHTFFKTRGRHLMITKGCKEWLIGDSLTSAQFAKYFPADAEAPEQMRRELQAFLSDDLAEAFDDAYAEGMDPVQLAMAGIELLAPTCAFKLDKTAQPTKAQAYLLSIAIAWAGELMVNKGLVDPESAKDTMTKYKDRLPEPTLEVLEEGFLNMIW